MKRIFLDTNILIDYIDNRAGADAAEQIFVWVSLARHFSLLPR